MRKKFLKLQFILGLFEILFFFQQKSYSAVDQLLNANFFPNPAELSLINNAQLIAGNVFIVPTLNFTGTTSLGSGKVKSHVNNSLPYLLTAYRVSDKFVLGINIAPSAYGQIDWPDNSFIVESSTLTRLFYYRIGAQTSYQFTDKLALGFGINLHYNKLAELDWVVPNMGNQINKIKGFTHSFDAGLFYKINSHTNFTMAAYTPVNTFGHGTSSLGATTVNNFSMNIIESAVAFIGLQHVITDKWYLEEKIYWSGWSIGVSRLRTLHLVGESPTEVKDSSLVAREAWWSESKTMEPSDNLFKRNKGNAPGCNVM